MPHRSLILLPIFILISLLLTGCSSTYVMDERKTETLNALAMNDDHFYVFGDPQDYQFKRTETKDLEAFIASPYAKKVAAIEAQGYVKNRTATAHLTFLLLPSTFSHQEQQQLMDEYGFKRITKIDQGSLYHQNPALSAALKKKPELLRRDYGLANGKLIRFDRTKFQPQALSKPLPIIVEYGHTTTKIHREDATMIILSPLLIAAIIPVYLVWGLSCNNGGC